MADAERRRLATDGRNWKRWGPYVSERAWGTVREDYGADGNPWDYFPHDHARSRAYRWSEDGLAGICDEPQVLCFGLALWNGRDPILKERLFGLTGKEGNHGEDVKEYWWYLFHRYLGDEFRVEMPTGSGRTATLEEIANELAWRLVGLFLNDAAGRRPVFRPDGYQTDPAWHDMIPFHEYFHGDTGAGLGASHQTGWTGLVVDLILRHCGASKGA